mgnify:CR=1 FL=1
MDEEALKKDFVEGYVNYLKNQYSSRMLTNASQSDNQIVGTNLEETIKKIEDINFSLFKIELRIIRF